MFSKIFVEKEFVASPAVLSIQAKWPSIPFVEIDKIEDVFQKVKKPYLHKRTNLQLFLGKRKGELLVPAPDAYGVSEGKHFVLRQSLNCIYECQYCYLQGYFNSPDIVLYLNFSDFKLKIKEVLDKNPGEPIWIHTGEYSDSLALAHLTGELAVYSELLNLYPNLRVELRTKSVNAKVLEKIKPSPRLFVTMSASPDQDVRDFDLKTPRISHRLKFLKKVQDLGFGTGVHIDPVIYGENFEAKYGEFLNLLEESINLCCVKYFSLGVVRFTGDVYREFSNNYPSSQILSENFIKSHDDKYRYPRPRREKIFKFIESRLISAGVAPDRIYRCME